MEQKNDLIMILAKCASACEECLDACLDEDNMEMLADCMRSDRDCAKICQVAASYVASNSPFTGSVLTLCEEICISCSEACEKHEHLHCQTCAKACRECAEACGQYNA